MLVQWVLWTNKYEEVGVVSPQLTAWLGRVRQTPAWKAVGGEFAPTEILGMVGGNLEAVAGGLFCAVLTLGIILIYVVFQW